MPAGGGRGAEGRGRRRAACMDPSAGAGMRSTGTRRGAPRSKAPSPGPLLLFPPSMPVLLPCLKEEARHTRLVLLVAVLLLNSNVRTAMLQGQP